MTGTKIVEDVVAKARAARASQLSRRTTAATENGGLVDDLVDEVEKARAEVAYQRERYGELERLFDMRHAADMRAVARWRKEDPVGRDLSLPDHADMVCWLLVYLEEAEGRAAKAEAGLEEEKRGRTGKVVSKDDAVIEVRTFDVPPDVQAAITRRLEQGRKEKGR